MGRPEGYSRWWCMRCQRPLAKQDTVSVEPTLMGAGPARVLHDGCGGVVAPSSDLSAA